MMGLIVIQNQQSAYVHQKNDFENVLHPSEKQACNFTKNN